MERWQRAKDMLGSVPEKLRAVMGVLLAVGAAYLLAKVFAGYVGHNAQVFLPLWFLAVLVALALRYGMAVGVFGSVLSAAIFAMVLFSPVGSFRVSDTAARENLAWMVLGGVALSYLLAPSNSARGKS